ncbi:unnamed protein product [Penicillium roqueforti FM164]|uniref:Genomic scaffold, ProqFM164S02 n=1 Tax=Penicillium roqueforti (strain FM164) TaxID=1365484 RepID=W6Q932_PENRF|nr:unnamed protein product [Penicillium roqueforti FM164]
MSISRIRQKGWNPNEPDLDPKYVFRERIGDNIMSQVFQFKRMRLLKQYTKIAWNVSRIARDGIDRTALYSL